MASKEKVRAMLIIDIIGRPAEHLLETLEKLIEEMRQEKNVVIKSTEIKEPVTMKDNKDFFTTFAEIEVEVEDMMYLTGLMFKYMPAHIEVISPETVSLSNNEWSDILSEIVRRLHSYDEFTRIMQLENLELTEKMKKLTSKSTVKEIIEPKGETEKSKKTGKNKD